jgi:hypothetical protein
MHTLHKLTDNQNDNPGPRQSPRPPIL